MSNENNKMQVDIDNLFKQNVNDLSAIKELYRRIEEIGEKITQIKYIDSTLANKLKKEYEKLKRIILDENIQAKLADDIETINEKLTNDIDELNLKLTNNIDELNIKLTNDIETINSHLDTAENKISYFINPIEYGIVGDGITDDTNAVQKAIDDINERIFGEYGHTFSAIRTILIFPNVKLRITKTLKFKQVHDIDFASCLFISEVPEEEFLFDCSSYNATYKNGIFTGKNIFYIHNANLDQGKIIIEKCEFKGCEIGIKAEIQSSLCIIKECKFDDVRHPLIQMICDSMTFMDNWATCGLPLNDCEGNIVVNAGKLVAERNIFIPVNTDDIVDNENAWIEFKGYCLESNYNRFSGEQYNRCCINWKSKYKIDIMTGLSFKDNLIGHNEGNKPCAIRLFNFPNYMYVNNNYHGVLTHYLISLTDNFRDELISELDEIKSKYYLNYNPTQASFVNDKYNIFNYNINNNGVYTSMHTPTDYFLNENSNDWYFLSHNYKTDTKYFNKQKYVLNSTDTKYNGQDITFMQDSYTTGVRNIKLPIRNLNNATIKVNFNYNALGSNYNIYQTIFASEVVYYDSAIRKEIKYKNLFDNYTSDSPATVKVGVYDEEGNYYFDDVLPTDYKGIALQFPGTKVSVGLITIEC